MIPSIAFFIVNQRMKIVIIEEVLGTALTCQVIFITIRIIGKWDINLLVGLVLM
jgi:hypothetical protein